MASENARHLRYPDLYSWLVFLSALDLIFTHLVIYYGGREVNMVAAHVMEAWGFSGMVAYKFALVLLIIILCEEIGRRHDRYGKLLGAIGVGLTSVPVCIAVVMLMARSHNLI